MPDLMETSTVAAPVPAAAPAPAGEQHAPEQEQRDVAPPQGETTTQTDDAQPGDDKLTPEQRTIRKLERRISTTTARRGAAEREAQLLREQLQAFQARQTQPQADDERTEAQPAPEDVERRAREMARTMAADIAEGQKISERVAKVLKDGETLDGFTAACNAVNDEVPFTDLRGRPTPFARALLDADHPAALLQYLGEHLDEASEFARLTPEQTGRRIARLESRIEQATRTTSAAPKPLTPVSASAAPAMPDPVKQPAAWREWRNKTAKRG